MKLGVFLLEERGGAAGQDRRLRPGQVEHQLLDHLLGDCLALRQRILVPLGPMDVKLLGPELDAALGALMRGGQSPGEIPLREKFVIDLYFWLNDDPFVDELVEVREVDLRARELHALAAVELHGRVLQFYYGWVQSSRTSKASNDG